MTGAGNNIGRAIALRFAREGASVAVNDIDPAAARQTVRDIETLGGRAVAATGDVCDAATVDALFDDVERDLGLVDALVNNAYARIGATSFQPFLTVAIQDWQAFVAANTTMFFACTQRAARGLAAARRPGTIVNISSHGAARAHREHIPYDSVKGALESFTRAVAVDLAPWEIRVNGLRPGSIAVTTERMDWADPGAADDIRNTQIPLARAGGTDDVAAAVYFLTCDDSAYVTGQIFNVDGGLAAQARAPQVEPHPVATPRTLTDFPRRLL